MLTKMEYMLLGASDEVNLGVCSTRMVCYEKTSVRLTASGLASRRTAFKFIFRFSSELGRPCSSNSFFRVEHTF